MKTKIRTDKAPKKTYFTECLLYINYLAHKTKDEVSLNLLKARLISTKPQFQLQDSNFVENHMLFYANELDKYVDEIVDEIVKEDVLCYGMSTNLHQWVFSSIVAKKIKDKKPECKIIIGGIGTKEAAVSYLKRFDQFDFAIWGEGEYALLSLCEQLEKCEIDFDYEDLTNTAFRGDNTIKISKTKTPCYIDLSSPDIRPDFSDYINKKKETEYFKSVKLTLPIESSRGCHWHKCHFCYLNTGYRYRLKSIDSICSEIRQQINNSQPDFFFLFWTMIL